MTGLPIELIDFSQTGAALFQAAVNMRYTALCWYREDEPVAYVRSETNTDFPEFTSVFIEVDKYPGLVDEHPLVLAKGRSFVMPLTFKTDDLDIIDNPEA